LLTQRVAGLLALLIDPPNPFRSNVHGHNGLGQLAWTWQRTCCFWSWRQRSQGWDWFTGARLCHCLQSRSGSAVDKAATFAVETSLSVFVKIMTWFSWMRTMTQGRKMLRKK
jgi:hypothetical protein